MNGTVIRVIGMPRYRVVPWRSGLTPAVGPSRHRRARPPVIPSSNSVAAAGAVQPHAGRRCTQTCRVRVRLRPAAPGAWRVRLRPCQTERDSLVYNRATDWRRAARCLHRAHTFIMMPPAAAQLQQRHLLVASLLLAVAVRETGGTPAHDAALYAAVNKDSRVRIERALDAGANINAQSERTQYFTPLMLAAQQGRGNAVPVLLERGADTELTDKDGFTAMHVAAFHGEVSALTPLPALTVSSRTARLWYLCVCTVAVPLLAVGSGTIADQSRRRSRQALQIRRTNTDLPCVLGRISASH